MRGQLPVAVLAILIGALGTTGGVQEVVYMGILKSRTEALEIGTFGTVTGILLLSAGIALLVRSKLVPSLVAATVYVSVPFYILAGIIKHYTGWPMTAIGIGFPLLLLLWLKLNRSRSELSGT